MVIQSTMFRLLVLVFLNLNLAFCFLNKKPDYIDTCFFKQKEFQKCSTKTVQKLFDQLPKGIPAIGLETLDPLKIPIITILQGLGPVNVNASLNNVTVVGFGHSQILSNTVDPVNYDFYTKLRLPKIRIDGNYNLLGRILLIPLRGKGQCWFEAKDLDIAVQSDVDLYKKEGFRFYNVTGVHVKFSIGGLKLYMGNLFDGIKALEETTNAYLNANWRPVAESLYPILVKTIEDIMLGILQKVFHNIPADFFVGDFPDS